MQLEKDLSKLASKYDNDTPDIAKDAIYIWAKKKVMATVHKPLGINTVIYLTFKSEAQILKFITSYSNEVNHILHIRKTLHLELIQNGFRS